MMLAIAVTLFALIVWLLTDHNAREHCLAALGYSAKQAISPLASGNNRAVAFLIFIALLVAVNPEMRLLLLFIDAVGVDVLLMLVLFQVQGGISWVGRVWGSVLWRTLRNWGPIPFSVPTSATLRQYPIMTVCSVASPIMAVAFIAALSFLTCVVAMAVVRPLCVG